jgi:NAD-dependent dihydropyrimidine dehydrogenase PreA subunit
MHISTLSTSDIVINKVFHFRCGNSYAAFEGIEPGSIWAFWRHAVTLAVEPTPPPSHKEEIMPYVIEKICSGTETACMEACPFDCIHPNKNEMSLEPLFYIDAETCTDCGACAIACPESAIAPAAEFGHYAGPAAQAKQQPYDSHLQVISGKESERPAFEVIAEEWFTAFATAHP